MSFKRDCSGYAKQDIMRLHVLTDEQCEKIISLAADYLCNYGVMVKSNKAIDLLKKAGCQIEVDMVKVPMSLIKSSLESVPSGFKIYDRKGNEVMDVSGYNTYYGPGLTNTFVLDVDTGKRRDTVKTDARDAAIVADALPNVDYVMGLSGITDCHPEISDTWEMWALFQNTSKPICAWSVDLEGFKATLDMCIAIAGSLEQYQKKPFMFAYVGNPKTPFVHMGNELEKVMFCAENGIPFAYPIGSQSGAISPITQAGALTCTMIDNIFGIVMSQVTKKGAPFMGALHVLTFDMKTTHACYASPEFNLCHIGNADIHHYLSIPTWCIGGATDSKILDEQAAVEAATTILTNEFAGSNIVHDLGFLEGGLAGSLEHMVLGDEIVGYARRMSRGIEVNDNTIAYDVIKAVGVGGNFFEEEHTMEHLYSENWMPTLLDRFRFGTWKKDKKDMRQRIKEKTKDILATHKPEKLPDDVVATIDAILERERKRVGEI